MHYGAFDTLGEQQNTEKEQIANHLSYLAPSMFGSVATVGLKRQISSDSS